MKQTSRILSTYSADVFGVCSALFELGGMVVMHDASGCNSTYTTHDEPRWFDMDSMIYISGISEMEAVMGDDSKLIEDICLEAAELHPRFIAVAGTPIPTMTGFDFRAVARIVEARTGIPAFGFPTTGMETYIRGVQMAWDAAADRFVDREARKSADNSCNILGLTPLDFSVNSQAESLQRFFEHYGYRVNARWAMGADLEELARSGEAHVNMAVSETGYALGEKLREMFGTPMCLGVPVGGRLHNVEQYFREGFHEGETAETCIIGEKVFSLSLAAALEHRTGRICRVLGPGLDEDDVIEALEGVRTVIADPLYEPVCPEGARFIRLPHEAYSGRLYRAEIPDLVTREGFEAFCEKL